MLFVIFQVASWMSPTPIYNLHSSQIIPLSMSKNTIFYSPSQTTFDRRCRLLGCNLFRYLIEFPLTFNLHLFPNHTVTPNKNLICPVSQTWIKPSSKVGENVNEDLHWKVFESSTGLNTCLGNWAIVMHLKYFLFCSCPCYTPCSPLNPTTTFSQYPWSLVTISHCYFPCLQHSTRYRDFPLQRWLEMTMRPQWNGRGELLVLYGKIAGILLDEIWFDMSCQNLNCGHK